MSDLQPDELSGETPLTQELLVERCGFTSHTQGLTSDWLFSRESPDRVCLAVIDGWEWRIEDWRHCFDLTQPPQTLGELRALARSFGIPLERTTP